MSRVPGSYRGKITKRRLEVATGGRPEEAVMAAIHPYTETKTASALFVHHDEGCPCTAGSRSLRSCTCELVQLELHTTASEETA